MEVKSSQSILVIWYAPGAKVAKNPQFVTLHFQCNWIVVIVWFHSFTLFTHYSTPYPLNRLVSKVIARNCKRFVTKEPDKFNEQTNNSCFLTCSRTMSHMDTTELKSTNYDDSFVNTWNKKGAWAHQVRCFEPFWVKEIGSGFLCKSRDYSEIPFDQESGIKTSAKVTRAT